MKLHTHLKTFIPANQQGFTKSKSTTTNLLEKSQFITESTSKGNQVDVIYFDLSKAFDVINRQILAQKLARLSMPFTLFYATMNFVIGRSNQLKVDGKPMEHTFDIHSSVPQGSHCGPLLLLSTTKFFAIVNNIEQQIELQKSINKLY